ncbi:hypothetical protein DFH11DRAFT_775957 [Phellopilus nigrolimitatus]|nr:hypothetical protein DFH11DRAFT_775957 [Phellopilus nigrolimitatus]
MLPSFAKFVGLGVFATALLNFVSADCPASNPDHLCCESFTQFSGNYYVWHNLCGLDYPNSTTVGSLCNPQATCSSGVIALCCESEASLGACGGDVDGPLGINCVEVES